MLIGIYLEEYQVGGVDYHLISLVKDWPNSNDRFLLFTNHDSQGLKYNKDIFESIGIKVKVFKSYSYMSQIYKIQKLPLGNYLRYFLYPFYAVFFYLQYLQALKLFKSNKIDFLFSNNGAYPGAIGSLAAILAAKKSKIKRVLLVHHCATPYQFLRKSFEVWLDKAISQSTTIITVSRATRDTILQVRSEIPRNTKFEVIYNGTPTTFYEKENLELKKILNDNTNKKIIGIIGRIENYKGHEDLIRALGLLNQEELSQVQVVFVGTYDKSQHDALQFIAKELKVFSNITFTGFIDGDSKNVISNFDLLMVLTRDFEGFGLTLIEAMAVGVPILSTNVGAIPEFITSGKNGYLINPEAPREIAAAIKDFLVNEIHWKVRAEFALSEIEKFSAKRMSKDFSIKINEIYNL